MPYPEEVKPVEAAFNCSIIERDGRLWMAARAECQPYFKAARIFVTPLDLKHRPIGPSVILPLETSFQPRGVRAEDPRWVCGADGRLWLAYNDNYRQWLAEMSSPTEVVECRRMLLNVKQQEREKNWSFFEVGNRLHGLYDSGENFRVFEVHDKHVAKIVHAHKWNAHRWDYGIIRGGASPVFHRGVFYHFFHSSAGIDVTPFGIVRRYFTGVMTFEAAPPFRPLRLSEEPILRGIVERTPDPKSSLNPAVFVCGARRAGDEWALSYGLNNLNCGEAFVSDLLVEKLLKPVTIFQ